MKKFELIKMLENVEDNAEITFVTQKEDRDGYPYDATVNVYKVLGGEIVRIEKDYGIIRIENKK